MSIYDLKPAFQNIVRPTARWLVRRRVTANQVTLLTCLASILYGGLMYGVNQKWVFALLPLFLFLRMAFNAIDGIIAREHRQQSAIGGYINELTDVVADSAIYYPLVLLPFISSLQILIFIWLSVLSEMTGVLGAVHGHGRRYDGPMGKSDRAFVMGTLALIYAVFDAALLNSILYYVMWAVNLLLILTIYKRIKNGLRPPTTP